MLYVILSTLKPVLQKIRFLQITKSCPRKKEFYYKISSVMLHVLQGKLVLQQVT